MSAAGITSYLFATRIDVTGTRRYHQCQSDEPAVLFYWNSLLLIYHRK